MHPFSPIQVSIEFVKVGASLFLSWDLDLYDEESGPVIVKTSNLLEELGQVNHIFTDKTGTLTENRMTLRKLTVLGQMYDCTGVDPANPSPIVRSTRFLSC